MSSAIYFKGRLPQPKKSVICIAMQFSENAIWNQ